MNQLNLNKLRFRIGDTMVMSPTCKSGNKSINTYLRLMTCDKPINMGV